MSEWLTIASWNDLGLELVRPIDLQAPHRAGLVGYGDLDNLNQGTEVWWFLRWTKIPPFPSPDIHPWARSIWEEHKLIPLLLMFDLYPLSLSADIFQLFVTGVTPFPIGAPARNAIVWMLYDLLGLTDNEIAGSLSSIEPSIPIHPTETWIDKHSLIPDSFLPVLATYETLNVPIWQWPVLLPQKQFEDYVESLEKQ
jgi:hypothetical protein